MMIGNPSTTPVTTLSILALHTTILSRPIIAHDAAASASMVDDERPHYQTQRKKKHLRRPVIDRVEGSSSSSSSSGSEQVEWSNRQHNGHNERLYKLRNILEYSGAAFLKGEDPEYDETHSAIDLHANDYEHSEQPPSWLDDWKDYIIHYNYNSNNSVSDSGGSGDDDCATAASSQYWYPDLTTSSTQTLACTNSLLHYHPTSWVSEASIAEIVMFTSGEECCNTLTDLMMGEDGSGHDDDVEGEIMATTRTCVVQNDCKSTNNSHPNGASLLLSNQILLEHDTTTTNTTIPAAAAVIDNGNGGVNQQQQSSKSRRRRLCAAATSLGFHPDTESEKGCTNSKVYPPPWERDQLKVCAFFFFTIQIRLGCTQHHDIHTHTFLF